MPTPIHGWNDPRFDAVRTAFEENFASADEIGAAVAVYVNGEPVVDLWGGWYALDRKREWDRNTLVNVFSSTKGLVAFCANRLVEQGRLDLDAPVARYWPEFAQAGKADVPVRMLLNHQAGIAAVRRPLVLEDYFNWDTVTTALAEQEPWWTPGEQHGYHAMTFGWLVGEVIRRVDGRTVGQYFREEFAAPLDLDAHIGTGPEFDARISSVIEPQADFATGPSDAFGEHGSVGFNAIYNPPIFNPGGPAVASRRDWKAAEIPAANGHATARALARIYGGAVNGGEIDGVHVINPETLARGVSVESNGQDAILPVPTKFGLGWGLMGEATPFGADRRAFGHGGAGGSLGFGDLDGGIGFGYVMNRMGADAVGDLRAFTLLSAVYESL